MSRPESLLAGWATRTLLLDMVARAFHPTRSGDVVVVQQPFWYLCSDATNNAAMHGSPYSYGTFVPILWVAPGGSAAIVNDPISPRQIAPTLCAELGIKPPSGCLDTAVLPR